VDTDPARWQGMLEWEITKVRTAKVKNRGLVFCEVI
jgi:hypothetical protein